MTTLTQPIRLPTTTTARLAQPGRLERSAVRLGIALLRWANSRAAEPLTHGEHSRLRSTVDGIRDHEQAALRLRLRCNRLAHRSLVSVLVGFSPRRSS